MYDAILVPTDGTDGTEAVLDHAMAIAAPHGATVTALYVVDTRVVRSSDDDPASVRADLEQAGTEALEAATARGEAAGVEVVELLQEGTPSREIRTVADDIDADLVVMGSHGKSPKEKVQGLGSVSESVVNNADRPVLVTRLAD